MDLLGLHTCPTLPSLVRQVRLSQSEAEKGWVFPASLLGMHTQQVSVVSPRAPGGLLAVIEDGFHNLYLLIPN